MKSSALSKSIIDEHDFVSYKTATAFEINEAYFIVCGYNNNANIIFLTNRVSSILHNAITDSRTIENTKIYGWATYCKACGLDSQYNYCYGCYELIKDKAFVNVYYIPVLFERCEYISYINKETYVYEKKIHISSHIGEKIIGILYIRHTQFSSTTTTCINFVVSKIDNIPYRIPIEARVEYNLRKYMRYWLLMREFIIADLFAPIVSMMICE
jgi:hypothetical protein